MAWQRVDEMAGGTDYSVAALMALSVVDEREQRMGLKRAAPVAVDLEKMMASVKAV